MKRKRNKRAVLLAHYMDSVNQSVERENLIRTPTPTFFGPVWILFGAVCLLAGCVFVPHMV